MSDERTLWGKIGNLSRTITKLENRVLGEIQPPLQQERILPFFETAWFDFDTNQEDQIEIPLVQSANRLTYITGLTYRVSIVGTDGLEYLLITTPAGFTAEVGTEFPAMFDFEWNFSLGTTERSYSHNSESGGEWLSRYSLGYMDNENTLLFSQKDPLVLGTNEFFNIKVKPTIGYLGDVATYYRVAMTAYGYRKLSAR